MGDEPLKHTSSADWRRWLMENHASSSGVWVTVKKKRSGVNGLTYDELLDQALCFGWIDGSMRSVDANSFVLRFSPRRKDSIWSMRNRKRITELMGEDLVADAGLRAVEEAKASGRWDAAYASSQVTVPVDLTEAIRGTAAERGFEKAPNSVKLQWVHWLGEAKKPETRKRRIERILTEFAST